MAQNGKSNSLPPAPTVLVVFLTVLAMLSVLAGGIISCVSLYDSGRHDGLSNGEIVSALVILAGGTVVGCLLWALAYVVRIQYETAVALRRLASQRAPVAAPADTQRGPADAQLHLLHEMVRQMAQLNAAQQSRASAAARSVKRQIQQAPLAPPLDEAQDMPTAEAVDARPAPVAMSEPPQSLAVTEELPSALDDDGPVQSPEGAGGDGELAQDAPEPKPSPVMEAASHELQTCRTRAEDLMALGHFDQAEAAVRQLLQVHTGFEPAERLLERIKRESDIYHREMRLRMKREVEKQSEARQWRQAVVAGRKLIDAYPDSHEARQLALRMDTLEDNARIEEVRELRDQIRDMLDRRRYVEAVKVAEDVMERFPETQAAAELRGQIGRLRGLARGENLP
ncbi:MAG: hypothetical protein ABFD92_18660 [Planctomycetaceae bacterium]|nr:hypothetical protein [Planctomycetaceae bacterium]